jgi:hypothetical protein
VVANRGNFDVQWGFAHPSHAAALGHRIGSPRDHHQSAAREQVRHGFSLPRRDNGVVGAAYHQAWHPCLREFALDGILQGIL